MQEVHAHRPINRDSARIGATPSTHESHATHHHTQAFAAVVALTALIGVLSITRAASLKDDTVQLGERLVPAAETVGLLKEETGKYRRNQLIFATGAQDLDDVQAELDGSLEALPALVGTYRKLALDGNSRAALAAFEAKWKAYVEATAGMQALGRAREHSAALATERRQGQPVAIDEANQGAAGTRVAAATDGANSGRTLTLALLVASLLVAAALAFVSIRSVKIRLARLPRGRCRRNRGRGAVRDRRGARGPRRPLPADQLSAGVRRDRLTARSRRARARRSMPRPRAAAAAACGRRRRRPRRSTPPPRSPAASCRRAGGGRCPRGPASSARG